MRENPPASDSDATGEESEVEEEDPPKAIGSGGKKTSGTKRPYNKSRKGRGRSSRKKQKKYSRKGRGKLKEKKLTLNLNPRKANKIIERG